VLNTADPDCPSGHMIVRAVASYLGHGWQEVLLDADVPDVLGRHPWDRVPPFMLDTRAARDLGYVPVGDCATTVADEIDWLVSVSRNNRGGIVDGFRDQYGSTPSDYVVEDRYLERTIS
jgi:hypothetical protein